MQVISTLKEHHIPVYYVGGFVRDRILGRPSKDVDLIVDWPLDQVYPLLKGKKALIKGKLIRLTQGAKVEISQMLEGSLEADLSSRDFTVNAMAMTPEGQIIDYVGGVEDCQLKVLRLVKEQNLLADYGRAIKGIRQAVELGFTIAPQTLELFARHANLAGQIAPERIQLELNKIVLLPQPSIALDLLRVSGILAEVLPELQNLFGQQHHNSHHQYDIYWHTLHAVDNADISGLNEDEALIVRLAALGHDLGKPAVRTVNPKNGQHRFLKHQQVSVELFRPVLTRLTYGYQLIDQVLVLVREHMRQHELLEMSDYKFRKFMYGIRNINPDLLLLLFRADVLAKGNTGDEVDTERLEQIGKRMADCQIKELAITGKDIMEHSTLRGPEIGQVKVYLMDQILRKPELNQRETLLKLVEKYSAR